MCLGSPASTTRLIAATYHNRFPHSFRTNGQITNARTARGEDCIGNCRWEHDSLSVLSDDQLADDAIFQVVGPRVIRQPANELS